MGSSRVLSIGANLSKLLAVDIEEVGILLPATVFLILIY